MTQFNKRTVDEAAQLALKKAEQEGIITAWDRDDMQKPHCGFGELGLCCRLCDMGPCRIDPFKEGARVGVCGADADTIAARNLLRQIAAGAAAHSDHGRDVAHTLLLAAEGKTTDYKIKNPDKLIKIAREWQIKTDGREILEIAKDVAITALKEW